MRTADLVIVGAGAAGLATAIHAAAGEPSLRVVCLDGAKRVGAKILVSGGSRCNVTNRVVTERDFWGGTPRVVRSVLRAYPAEKTVEFFSALGVALHEEEDGKLFPDTNSSRTVLNALLDRARTLGIELRESERVTALGRDGDEFSIVANGDPWRARVVVLATGGRSLPKTGSDGFGYGLARAMGHSCTETTPALVPLVLGEGGHTVLSGVTHDVALTVRTSAWRTVLAGSMLWTHFGASGPAVLNASRHWHRAVTAGDRVTVTLNLFPGSSFDDVDRWLQEQSRDRPRALVATVLATRMPAAVASAYAASAGLDERTLAHMSREERRALIHTLTESTMDVRDSRGYNFAEVTAGGVPLDEIDSASMESRLCRGLYLVGEILDVDGRLGGFNFQWAWSSGWVAGQAIGRARPR